jgi:hypothetical protein
MINVTAQISTVINATAQVTGVTPSDCEFPISLINSDLVEVDSIPSCPISQEHPLPDIDLTDDNGVVGSYPMTTDIVIDGEVSSATYLASTNTLTIVPTAPTPDPVTIEIDGVNEGTVASGGTAEILLEDSGGNPVTPDSVTKVGDVFTVVVPAGGSGLIYQRSSFRGVPAPYSDYDLRWQIDNETYDYGNPTGTRVSLDFTNANPFYHVTPNNAFGNNKRFTDSQGNGAPDGLAGFSAIDWAVDRPSAIPFYVIDHLTGLGWIVVKIGFQEEWDVALATANGLSHGGFSDYRVQSTGEMEDVLSTATSVEFYGAGNIFYRNNNFATGTETSLWLNSTHESNNTLANILNSSGDISRASKNATTGRATYAVRTHYP